MKNYLIDIPKLGKIWAKINGCDSFYLTTNGEAHYQAENAEQEIHHQIIVRNIPYSVNMHVRLYDDGQIDGQCWEPNGNDLIRASEARGDYQRTNACNASRRDISFSNHSDTSLPAKLKIQSEVLKAINKFYQDNKGEIDFEWRQLAIKDAEIALNATKSKIIKLKNEIANLEDEENNFNNKLVNLKNSNYVNWRNIKIAHEK